MFAKKKTYLWLLLAAALFVLLNLQIPKVIDDYPYSRSFVGVMSMHDTVDVGLTIDGPTELIRSQLAHYLHVNGRLPVHTVVQIFCCWLGKVWFDLLQGIMLATVVVMLGRLLGLKAFPTKESAGREGSMAASADGFSPGLGVVALLLAGFAEPSCLYNGIAYSTNYLWTLALCLSVRWLYVRENRESALAEGGEKPANTWRRAWRVITIVALAFVAGWSNEAIALPFTAAMVLEALAHRRRLTRRQWSLIAALCLGALLLVATPANFNRLDDVASESLNKTSALPYHLQCLPNLRLTALWLLLSVAAFLFKRSALQWRSNAFWLSMLSSGVLLSMAIGGTGLRQNFGTEFCAAVLIVGTLRQWLSGRKALLLFKHGLAAALCLILLGINVIQRPMSQQFETARQLVEQDTATDVRLRLPDISLPPQLEKWRCAQLSDFQLEQFAWWYGKHSVGVSTANE